MKMKDEKPVADEIPREPPKWERRETFRINERMKEVIGLTIKASEAELAVLRRKLDKLTYGS